MGDPYPLKVVVLPRQPRLDRLVRVVPIAQVQETSGIDVLALSLERYTASFVIIFQAQSHGAVPFFDEAPQLKLMVTDDRERAYDLALGDAAGEGAHRDWQWRHTYRCFPALPQDATKIRLTIASMTWLVPDPRREGYVPVLTAEGPWAFIVPLAPMQEIP